MKWLQRVFLLLTQGPDWSAAQTAAPQVTPLHRAADEGNRPLVEELLAKGAEVNAKDNDGWTPLQFAAQQGHHEVVLLLRKYGAKP